MSYSSSRFTIDSDDEHADSKSAYDADSNAGSTTNTNNDLEITKNQHKHNNYQLSGDVDSTFAINIADTTLYDTNNPLPLSKIIDISEFGRFQKYTHFVIYPLIWITDVNKVRNRVWLQLPLLKYMIVVTSMIIGIICSKLVIKGYELRAFSGDYNGYDVGDVIYVLVGYTVLISLLCSLFLYFVHAHHFVSSIYHYIFLVQTSCGVIAYAILFLLVHVQYKFFSESVFAAISCLTATMMYSSSFLGSIVFLKHFVFDLRARQEIIADSAVVSDEVTLDDSNDEFRPLLPSNIAGDEFEDLSDENIIINGDVVRMQDPHERMMTSYNEKGAFWFTVSQMTLNIWHVGIGLILIECVVFILVGDYVNLLMDWTGHSRTILGNIWNIIVFGMVLAFLTGAFQCLMQMYCKTPLFRYESHLSELQSANVGLPSANASVVASYWNALPHKEDLILFLLAWLNDVNYLWNRILASAIGWSLLTPNQTNRAGTQFLTAITASFLFLLIGFIISDYKRRISRDVFESIKKLERVLKTIGAQEIERKTEIENKIIYKKQKLIFYDQLHNTYDLAFAVAVSFSWESFISITLIHILGDEPLNRFVAYLVLTFVVVSLFTQLGLELVDLKKQRLKEAKQTHRNYIKKMNKKKENTIKPTQAL